MKCIKETKRDETKCMKTICFDWRSTLNRFKSIWLQTWSSCLQLSIKSATWSSVQMKMVWMYMYFDKRKQKQNTEMKFLRLDIWESSKTRRKNETNERTRDKLNRRINNTFNLIINLLNYLVDKFLFIFKIFVIQLQCNRFLYMHLHWILLIFSIITIPLEIPLFNCYSFLLICD